MIKPGILLIVPAQNFNEEEYLVISNALNHAGINIFIASDSNSLCVGTNGLKVKNDIQLYNIHESNFRGLILLGGSGMRDYWNNKALMTISAKFANANKPTGAICCAPVILARAGVIKERATCFPDDKKELEREGIAYVDEQVFVNKNIITAQNPSSAREFINAFIYELKKSN